MPERHSIIRDGKRLIWLTEELWEKARDLEPFEIRVSEIRELDRDCWFQDDPLPMMREVAEHCGRINAASLDHPIILNDDGSLMDGGHRLCKALLEGREKVLAV